MPMDYKGQPVEHIQWNGNPVMDSDNKLVIINAKKGIDNVNGTIKNTYAYANGKVTKQEDGSYRIYYSSGGGTSSGTFTIDIPEGYKGFVAKIKNASKMYECHAFVNGTLASNGRYNKDGEWLLDNSTKESNRFGGFGYYDDNGFKTNRIIIELSGSYGGSNSNVSQFDIEFLAFLK